ncbi:hypothetical protein DFQ10_108203 [Winogradskyella eximia]|uniref:Adhesin domain-containing protein n=1 Tax=Winogradskyella eximia TaxID=262006 RepID=A0A3D9H1R2_9FLAO|nr:hypothetical protein [Winogradskyella eximia]RED42796.1 hypothetical protein DFQ10_108203 [Winogradskyella eximia]
MKTPFKIFALMLITSLQVQSQIKDIYKESFDATNLKNLVLDLEGTYVVIEASEDNKVYFDYTIEFENYSNKEIDKILEAVEPESQIVNDKLEFKSKGSNISSDVTYSFETLYGITFEGDYINFKEPTTRQFRKSKQYFLDINSSSRGKSLKEYLKNLREVDDKGEKRKINSKNVKILRTKFTIKIPSHLNLRLMAVNSNMTFKLDLESQLNVNARNTSLKFQSIQNPLNNLDIVNGSFRSNTLNGGAYKFNHVDEVQIAEVRNLTIDGEFSTTKIGEIGQHVKIVDFNGKFWLHNFSQDFKSFQMDTEYSEINLFYPENMDYYIETYGNDTVHYYGNIITEIPPSRKNELSKMMVIGEESNPNKIQINTAHGIIRFGSDFIDLGE